MNTSLLLLVILVEAEGRTSGVWRTLLELGRREPQGWTLIGAQMVALHAFEHGRMPPRASLDGDVLVDVRLLRNGTSRISRVLTEMGFELTEITTDERGHRFQNGGVLIDVLAPDGLGDRTALTTIPPAHTIPVPGGSQALERTEWVEVRLGWEDAGLLPRPNLLGALLIKSRAVDVDDAPDNQRRDVALLLSLIQDPRAIAQQLRPGERGSLQRRADDMLDPRHPAWIGITGAEDARRALRILTQT